MVAPSTPRHLYLVRCRFVGTPQEEVAWNEWYSGPKLVDMLQMPMFHAGRRYRSTAGDGQYIAVWEVDGPQAFESSRYRQRWGFHEWEAHVTDWHRDLMVPSNAATGVRWPSDCALVVYGFSSTEVDTSSLPEALWCTSVGLDGDLATAALFADDGATQPAPAGMSWSRRYDFIGAH